MVIYGKKDNDGQISDESEQQISKNSQNVEYIVGTLNSMIKY